MVRVTRCPEKWIILGISKAVNRGGIPVIIGFKILNLIIVPISYLIFKVIHDIDNYKFEVRTFLQSLSSTGSVIQNHTTALLITDFF